MPTFPAEVEKKRERERLTRARFCDFGNDDGGKDVETQAFVVAALSSKRNPRGVDRSSLDRSRIPRLLSLLCVKLEPLPTHKIDFFYLSRENANPTEKTKTKTKTIETLNT